MAKSDDSKQLYIDSLVKEIAQQETDKKALIAEFEKVASEELTPERIRDKIRDEILPTAWVSLLNLIANAESESVRASMIRWAFDYASRTLPSDSPDRDPDKELTTLLRELANNDKG